MITEHTFLLIFATAFVMFLYAITGARISENNVVSALVSVILWGYLTFMTISRTILIDSVRYVTNISSNTTYINDTEMVIELYAYDTATTYMTDGALSALCLLMTAASMLIFIYVVFHKLYADTNSLI